MCSTHASPALNSRCCLTFSTERLFLPGANRCDWVGAHWVGTGRNWCYRVVACPTVAKKSISVPDELWAKVEAEAARLDRSASWVVRWALEAQLVDGGARLGMEAGAAPHFPSVEPRASEEASVVAPPSAPSGSRSASPRVFRGRAVGPIPKGGK